MWVTESAPTRSNVRAREAFQTVFDQAEAEFRKYPVFIDREQEPAQHAARTQIEQTMMTASLNLALCTLEESRTYESTAVVHRRRLTDAADEFEKLHQKYRTQVAGLYARMWQGKCLEEMNDINKALGIYTELLRYPGESAALSQLQSQTLHFKLICLNHTDKKNFQNVVDLAEEWRQKHPDEQSTLSGLGIQYQLALAYESLGDNEELLKSDQETFWKKSRTISINLQKFNSENKDAAVALTQRLNAKLGDGEEAKADDFDEAKVDDFDTAFGLARQALLEAVDTKKEIEAAILSKVATPDELATLNATRLQSLRDAEKYFERALTLAKTDEDKKSLPQARLLHAHAKYNLKKYKEAAILGQLVAQTADKDDPLALDGAYLAMAAYVQAYNDNKAPADQKGEDLEMIIQASNLIAQRWPSSDKANDCYLMLGKLLSIQKKPVEAALWFGKVPESDPKYAQAQLSAGQAYWSAYIDAVRLDPADRPNAAVLTEWQQSAQDHLRVGIQKLTVAAPKEPSQPEIIGAKMTLAQILINQGRDAEALKLLESDPQSVVKAVAVADEANRPENGMTGRRFATETYKLVFRAAVGSQNLEKASQAIKMLNTMAAAGGELRETQMSEVLASLGRMFQEDLKRLRANGETERFETLRDKIRKAGLPVPDLDY